MSAALALQHGLELTSSCRGYSLKKIEENNTAEIMQTVLDDARESYDEQVVVELQSESPDDIESNVARIVQWVEAWKQNNAQ